MSGFFPQKIFQYDIFEISFLLHIQKLRFLINRAYTCPICGASGDIAHTVKYCPKGPYNPWGMSMPNTFKLLRNSAGKRRSK